MRVYTCICTCRGLVSLKRNNAFMGRYVRRDLGPDFGANQLIGMSGVWAHNSSLKREVDNENCTLDQLMQYQGQRPWYTQNMCLAMHPQIYGEQLVFYN